MDSTDNADSIHQVQSANDTAQENTASKASENSETPALAPTIESEVRGYVRTFPTVFTTAQGSILKNTEGKTFIDFLCGAGSLNYGHNNPRVKQALLDYISSDGIQHSLDTSTQAKLDFLNAFENIILKPRQLDYKLQFTGPTGTNAVEAAVKLARKVKQRSHIIAFSHGYHGHTLGALALTANDYYHDEHYGSRSNVSHLPFDGYLGDLDTSEYLAKVLADQSSGIPKPAAIILETIQGEGGINIASDAWLQRVEGICKQHDILLIVDDIQVGNGRTGKFFSFEHAGITPDIVCVSKSIGAGLPFSINLIKPEIDAWKPGEHTGTFRGNNLAFVAAKTVLEYWQEDFETHISERASLIESHLKKLTSRCKGKDAITYRGRGMIWGLDVGEGQIAKQIIQKCFAAGLMLESSGADDEVLKIMAALTIDIPTLKQGLAILDRVVAEVIAEVSAEAKSLS